MYCIEHLWWKTVKEPPHEDNFNCYTYRKQPKVEEVSMNLGDEFEYTKIHSIMHWCI
jgi:hypothetical protein